jgi:hypothetical protein
MPTNSTEVSAEIAFLDHEEWWVRTLYQLLWMCLFVLIAGSLMLTYAIALHYGELVFHYGRLYPNPWRPRAALALSGILSSIALFSWVWAVGIIYGAFLQSHVQAWRQRFRACYNRLRYSSTSSTRDSTPSVGT